MTSSPHDYETWSEFRYQIRRYLSTAEAAARELGLEPQQHQLLLAIRGFPEGRTPTISDLAERLQLRHHSTVELVDRMEQGGLVSRRPTGRGRSVAVELTATGRRRLDAVLRRLRPELETTATQLIDALSRLVAGADTRRRSPEPSIGPRNPRRVSGARSTMERIEARGARARTASPSRRKSAEPGPS